MSNIRVFLCDDHTLFRQGMRKLLELEQDIQIVGEASNGLQMLDLLKKTGPDVILMDIGMPKLDGVAATYKVKKI
ncbi:MAG: response regulator transcription factor, partial [Candidatus Omnitrophica bacterium]|nr:response regulator transcription factor [Candidatus Omnitrophota bacterium]